MWVDHYLTMWRTKLTPGKFFFLIFSGNFPEVVTLMKSACQACRGLTCNDSYIFNSTDNEFFNLLATSSIGQPTTSYRQPHLRACLRDIAPHTTWCHQMNLHCCPDKPPPPIRILSEGCPGNQIQYHHYQIVMHLMVVRQALKWKS